MNEFLIIYFWATVNVEKSISHGEKLTVPRAIALSMPYVSECKFVLALARAQIYNNDKLRLATSRINCNAVYASLLFSHLFI